MNRLWKLPLGEGIVRSPDDFGKQGQPPSRTPNCSTGSRVSCKSPRSS
ncbi:MAG: DUF1553 domain-containing protein [Gemmataceae bacterium]